MLVKQNTPVDAFAAFWTPWTAFLDEVLADNNVVTHHCPTIYLQRAVFLELFMVPGCQIAALSFRGLLLDFPSLLFCYFLLHLLHDPLFFSSYFIFLGHFFFFCCA
jgi:hypothetical protein